MQRGAPLHSGSGSGPWAVFTGIVALAIFGGFGGVLLFGSPGPLLPVVGGVLLLLALIGVPWQILDARHRRHRLTESGLHYSCGVVGRFDAEVPYAAIRGVTVHQGIWQRAFGCADVRVAVPGMSGPNLISSRDYDNVILRSIPDFKAVAELLQERMSAPRQP